MIETHRDIREILTVSLFMPHPLQKSKTAIDTAKFEPERMQDRE
jgi:hypothetical protein